MRFVQKIIGMSVLLGVLLVIPAQASASVNSFTINSFDADYYLTRDQQKHSQLKVIEKIVAEFPAIDQNHGIERALPEQYAGHNLRLQVESITDAQLQPLPFKSRESNHNKVLRIGDAGKYVHGRQTYLITYSMSSVTQKFSDHDEIFWNTNGTHWSQYFKELTARLHIDKSLAASTDGRIRCVQGSIGVTEQCITASHQTDQENVLTFSASRPLAPGENLSFAASFHPDTFTTYTPTTWERIFPVLRTVWLIGNGLALLALVIFSIRIWLRYGRPPQSRGTIIPEYLPPKKVSLLTAGTIGQKMPSTAQLLDLAVRHYIKIYETEQRKFFSSKKVYELELVKPLDNLDGDERGFAELIFNQPVVGSRVSTEELGKSLQGRMDKLLTAISKQAVAEGYYTDLTAVKKRYNKLGVRLLLVGGVLASPGLIIGTIICFIVINTLKPLSDKGVELRDYLDGLKMYMQLAETDRIRTLQSPEGAQKLPAGTDPNDKRQLVKLYERLLPYAVLFGIEKQWVQQFAALYEQPPEWYAGNWSTFNAAVFASSISSFDAAGNTAFAPPSSSSSSGFSGGGSGGGGGGGGGGGW